MADLGDYDPNVKALDPRDPVPTDWYHVLIHESEVKPNSAKTGDRLILNCVVMEGDFTDAEFEIGLNIRHPTAKAQLIAHREFKSICEAVGVQSPRDSNELHGKLFWVKLELEPGNIDSTGKQWPPKNVARDYRSDKDGPKKLRPPVAAPAQTAPTPAPTSAQQPSSNTPPWKRG